MGLRPSSVAFRSAKVRSCCSSLDPIVSLSNTIATSRVNTLRNTSAGNWSIDASVVFAAPPKERRSCGGRFAPGIEWPIERKMGTPQTSVLGWGWFVQTPLPVRIPS